jgi:hypothetical protein
MQETPIVACTLTESGMSERRRRWHELADRAFVSRVVVDRGLRLEFRPDAGVEDELRELALLERDCCRFATWEVGRADGLAVLDVLGETGEGIAAVKNMFRSLETAAALELGGT